MVSRLRTVTFHPTSTGISCPHCGSPVGGYRITQSKRNETKGCCPECRKWFVIELPVVLPGIAEEVLDGTFLLCRGLDGVGPGTLPTVNLS